MENTALFTRADIVDCQLFLSKVDNDSNATNNQWSTDSSICLIGRPHSRIYERCAFEVDGFDKSMDYFVDFGDGHGKRILSRKFHYQYMTPGQYNITLYIKAGETMIQLSTHHMRVEDNSISGAIRSISLF